MKSPSYMYSIEFLFVYCKTAGICSDLLSNKTVCFWYKTNLSICNYSYYRFFFFFLLFSNYELVLSIIKMGLMLLKYVFLYNKKNARIVCKFEVNKFSSSGVTWEKNGILRMFLRTQKGKTERKIKIKITIKKSYPWHSLYQHGWCVWISAQLFQ